MRQRRSCARRTVSRDRGDGSRRRRRAGISSRSARPETGWTHPPPRSCSCYGKSWIRNGSISNHDSRPGAGTSADTSDSLGDAGPPARRQLPHGLLRAASGRASARRRANTRHDKLPDNSPARWRDGSIARMTGLTTLRRIDPKRLGGPEMGRLRDHCATPSKGSVGKRVCRFELWSVAHTGGGWAVHGHRTRSAAGRRYRRRAAPGAHALARRPCLYRGRSWRTIGKGLRRGYTAPRHMSKSR